MNKFRILGVHATNSKQRMVWAGETERKEGWVFPKDQMVYFVMIYHGNKYFPIWKLKNAIVKNLLSLAEFFAQI